MKRLGILLFFHCIQIVAAGQKNYTIVYRTMADTRDTIAANERFAPFQLAIQDSIGFCYYSSFPIWPDRTVPVPLGSAYWPKSFFIAPGRSIQIFQDGQLDKPKTQVLREVKMDKGEWVITEDKKMILGYDCVKAYGTIGRYTYIAWYCPSLPREFGPYIITTLPGTVLEILNEKIGVEFYAVEIKEEALPITEPNYCKRVREKARN